MIKKMTKEEAKELVPDKDYVIFANVKYRVADVRETLGAVIIGIYDEPPSDHVDFIGASAAKKATKVVENSQTQLK